MSQAAKMLLYLKSIGWVLCNLPVRWKFTYLRYRYSEIFLERNPVDE